MVAVPRDSTTLLESVRETCKALNLGPQHSALVRTAEILAFTIDKMTQEERAGLLGQTAPHLIGAIDKLTAAFGPVTSEVRGMGPEHLKLLLGDLGGRGGAN